MDFSHLLTEAEPQKEKLLAFGFEEQNGKLILKRAVEKGDFFAVICITEKNITAEVFEAATGDKYVLFDVAKAQGSFVGGLRKQVQKLMAEIQTECFKSCDVKLLYEKYLTEKFGVKPDFPWSDLPDYSVYRCAGGKWFALIMKIKYKQLGFASDQCVWVVNLKVKDAEKKSDNKAVFPAYHMNKKYWITAVLTAAQDFDRLCALTEESFSLVNKK